MWTYKEEGELFTLLLFLCLFGLRFFGWFLLFLFGVGIHLGGSLFVFDRLKEPIEFLGGDFAVGFGLLVGFEDADVPLDEDDRDDDDAEDGDKNDRD